MGSGSWSVESCRGYWVPVVLRRFIGRDLTRETKRDGTERVPRGRVPDRNRKGTKTKTEGCFGHEEGGHRDAPYRTVPSHLTRERSLYVYYFYNKITVNGEVY